jgi:hypothetical protein
MGIKKNTNFTKQPSTKENENRVIYKISTFSICSNNDSWNLCIDTFD